MQVRRLFSAVQQNINPENFSKIAAGLITIGVFAAGYKSATTQKHFPKPSSNHFPTAQKDRFQGNSLLSY